MRACAVAHAAVVAPTCQQACALSAQLTWVLCGRSPARVHPPSDSGHGCAVPGQVWYGQDRRCGTLCLETYSSALWAAAASRGLRGGRSRQPGLIVRVFRACSVCAVGPPADGAGGERGGGDRALPHPRAGVSGEAVVPAAAGRLMLVLHAGLQHAGCAGFCFIFWCGAHRSATSSSALACT